MSPLSVDRAPSRDRSAYLAMMPQLEQQGFLRLPADPALRQAVDRAFALASAFFARPAEQKSRYAHPEWVEGYRELGPEYSQVPERPDLTEILLRLEPQPRPCGTGSLAGRLPAAWCVA